MKTIDELLTIKHREIDRSKVQGAMAPWYRKIIMPSQSKMDAARKAGVLLHVFNGGDGLEVLYMRRPAYEGTHGGQVSFPGGKHESGDKDFLQTALREAEEEVGLKATNVQVLRSLSPLYIPPSNFLVHPYLSYADHRPELVLDPKEVEHVFSIPVEALLSDELVGKTKVKTKMGTMTVPAYHWNGEIIWGATAMITAELTMLLS